MQKGYAGIAFIKRMAFITRIVKGKLPVSVYTCVALVCMNMLHLLWFVLLEVSGYSEKRYTVQDSGLPVNIWTKM